MPDLTPGHEVLIRVLSAAAMFLVLASWEAAAPRRVLALSRQLRWAGNLAVALVNTGVVRLLAPLATVGFAALAAQRGWGLFNLFDAPTWLAWVVSLLVLDLVTFLQHLSYHAVPLLWRLHRMHHADVEFDVTTGLRFHPFEVAVSLTIRFAVVAALGAPAAAVLVFEAWLNAASMFTHSNIRMPVRLDRALRRLIVTPDMHRIHHSVIRAETNSNFGFNLSCWDRLFGTYRQQPRDGHRAMRIGVDGFRTRRDLWLHRMLLQPLMGPGDDYPLFARSRSRRGRDQSGPG